MVISVRTEQGPDGLEIIKETASGHELERLAREAEWLRRAAHPGVVDIVSAEPGTLRLRHRGTALARLVPLPPDRAAAVVRAVAETVADLHQQGIAHNRISADHIVIGERGRPALCGFAQASDATDTARAGDVAALGALLDDLLDGGADLPWSPALRGARHARRRSRAQRALRGAAAAARREEPSHRPTAHHFATAVFEALPEMQLPAPPAASAIEGPPRRGFSDIPADFDPTDDLGWSDDDLSFLAIVEESDEEWITGQHATVELDDAPPAAPAPPVFAFEPADEADAGPELAGAEPPSRRSPPVITIRPAPPRPPTPPAQDRRVLVAVAAVLLVAGAVAGTVVMRSIRPFGTEDPIEAAATSTTTASTVVMDPATVEVRGTTTTGPTYPDACPVPEVPGPDIDGDACPEPIELEERVATVGSIRVELGEPGDLVAIADSDCDGVATPVVLRPSTGEVFVFPRWSLREPLEVRAATVVAGGEELTVDPGDCPAVAVTGDGVRRVVVD